MGPADFEVVKLAEVVQRNVTAHLDRIFSDVPVRLVDERVGLDLARAS